MGQKVNPIGLRLGYNRGWNAHWFGGKLLPAYLQQDSLIKEVIRTRYPKSGIASIEIFRNRGEITVVINTSKPGLIIGRSGAGAQELKSMIERRLFKNTIPKDRPNLRINIVEAKNPELSAQIVAETIAGQLERRISVKRAIRQAAERSLEKKAKGIKIKVSGRLGGAEIARSEAVSHGSIPLQTMRSDISYALAEAHTTFGTIGIKVWLYLGESDEFPMAAPVSSSRPSKFS